MSNKELIENINKDLENKTTQEIIEYFLTKFKKCSLEFKLSS